MAEAEFSTVPQPNTETEGPFTVLPATPDAVSADKSELGQATETIPIDVKATVSELHIRKPLSRMGSATDRSERSCIFETAYPKETERNTLADRINDFCFRHFGLCSHAIHPNKTQVTVGKPSDGLGVWTSELHSMCVKLAVYIGTTEYILGPRMAWHYGGFIFYFVVFFLILISSFPANFLESLVGQYTAKSVAVFLPQLGPVFRGLGYAMLFVTGLILVYYAIHVANVLMYSYHAAQAFTPWHHCNPDYNSKRCFIEKLQEDCNKGSNNTVYYDFKCVPASAYCLENGFADSNGTHCFDDHPTNLTERWMIDYDEQKQAASEQATKPVSVRKIGKVGARYIAARDFHYHYIYGKHECETNRSLPVCRNHARAFAVAYCTVWILALLPCFNLWVASTFAVIVIVASPLVIMLVMTRVILFPGAWTGVSNFFFGRASLRQLLTTSFWVDAFGMTFWSIVVGTGVVPTLSSRDHLRHNALRSSTILVTCDVAFGMLNSILLFSVRGYLERDSGFSKDQLHQLDYDSEALVFVAFMTITDGMPRPRFWGSIYFGTMAAQSLATLTVFITAAALNLLDAVPSFRTRPFSLAVAIAGSPFVLAAGVLVISVLTGVQWSVFPLVRLQLAFVQLAFIIVVGFKVSKPEFRDQVQLQTGIEVRGIWRWLVGCWLLVCPLILVVEILGQLSVYSPPEVPSGGLPIAVLSYIIVCCPVLALIAGALYAARTTPFEELCSTSREFGAREPGPRRDPASKAGSNRGRRHSTRPRGPIGAARSPGRRSTTPLSGVNSGEMRAAVTSEEMRWELAKSSTLLSVV